MTVDYIDDYTRLLVQWIFVAVSAPVFTEVDSGPRILLSTTAHALGSSVLQLWSAVPDARATGDFRSFLGTPTDTRGRSRCRRDGNGASKEASSYGQATGQLGSLYRPNETNRRGGSHDTGK